MFLFKKRGGGATQHFTGLLTTLTLTGLCSWTLFGGGVSAAAPSLRSLERQAKTLDQASFAFPRCVCTIHTIETSENGTLTAGVKLMSLAYRRYPTCNIQQDCKKRTADCPDFCREMGYKFVGKNSSLATVFNDTAISIGSEMCRRYNQPLPQPGLRIGVFFLAYSSQNSYGPRQVLKGPATVITSDDSLCCARVEHPISSKEKIIVFDPECKDRTLSNAVGGSALTAPGPNMIN